MLKLNQNNSLWWRKRKRKRRKKRTILSLIMNSENQALISTNETSDWSDEWDLPGPPAGRRLQSPLQLTVTPQRFVAMSRLPCDLPQRFKGALVPDVCVCWTRDFKVEVSWCLCPHGSLSVPFYPSRMNETKLPELPLYQLTSTFWHKIKKGTLPLLSSHWLNLEVLSCLVSLHRKAPISLLKAIWLSHQWEQLAKKSIGPFLEQHLGLTSIRNVRSNYCKCTQLLEATM